MAPRAGWLLAAVALLAVLGSTQAQTTVSIGSWSSVTTDSYYAFNAANLTAYNSTYFPVYYLSNTDATDATYILAGVYQGGLTTYLGASSIGVSAGLACGLLNTSTTAYTKFFSLLNTTFNNLNTTQRYTVASYFSLAVSTALNANNFTTSGYSADSTGSIAAFVTALNTGAALSPTYYCENGTTSTNGLTLNVPLTFDCTVNTTRIYVQTNTLTSVNSWALSYGVLAGQSSFSTYGCAGKYTTRRRLLATSANNYGVFVPTTTAAGAAYLKANGLIALQSQLTLALKGYATVGTISAQTSTNSASAVGTITDPNTGMQVSYSTSIIIVIIITVFSVALVVIGAVLLVRRHTALPATMSATQAPTEVFYYEPPVQGGRKPRA